jgi:hypothetical protein
MAKKKPTKKQPAIKGRWTKAETKRIVDRAFMTIMLAFANAALMEGFPRGASLKPKRNKKKTPNPAFKLFPPPRRD